MKERMGEMILIENEHLLVEIANKGAEIRSIWHKGREKQLMWDGDPAYWGRVSPVLFPIVGKLKDNQYTHKGDTYKLPQHGFLRDQVFVTNTLKQEEALFHFESSNQFADVYPFEFTAYIKYTLEGNTLKVSWKVSNDNNEPMYFSIGAHPAFNIPFREDGQLADYELDIQPGEGIKQYELKDGFVQEKQQETVATTLSLTDDLFATDALIYENANKITLRSTKDKTEQITVQFPDFPYVGVWSKYNEEDQSIAPFVCIEPWFGHADTPETSGELSKKKGIQTLQAYESFEASYTMTFS
ncbi:aldose 1-epimerase family protein [Bacillus sp. JCM 19041]|uniref:aldose 1-epimerase family protein n=1 Tax=Bacillus sp. JCM 19041 TaxID=1460637 RepID=UPI00336A8819